MSKHRLTGHLAAMLSVLIWGITFTSTKILLRTFSAIEVLFIRNLLSFLILYAGTSQKTVIREKKHHLYFAAAGLCGITLYYLLETFALTYTTAANAGVIISMSPFFIALLARGVLKAEKPGLLFYLGFLTAITGIVLITVNGSAVLALNPLGDLMVVGAAAVWAAYSILTRKISAFGYSTAQTTRRIFGYGVLFMLPALYPLDFGPDWRALAEPVNLGNLLFLSVCASALCFITWNHAVRVLGAVKTSVYIYLVPVVTVAVSAAVLHEPVTPLLLMGTGLTLLGLFLSDTDRPRKRP